MNQPSPIRHMCMDTRLVAREHHEGQHNEKEEDGIEEETEGCRAAGGTCDAQEADDFVEEFVGFGVCA